MQVWCNKQWYAPEDFPVSLLDRGRMHGLGLFETILAVEGNLVFLNRHLARLTHSCQHLGWDVPLPDLESVMKELLLRNQLEHGRARIRLTFTPGSGAIDDMALGGEPMLSLVATVAGEAGGSVIVNLSPWTRNEHSPLAGLKSLSYAENLIALDQARRSGFEETIFLNTAGLVCEAAMANLFIMKDGAIFTPSLESGCLPGITRQVVIELAGRCHMEARETSISVDDLMAADEVFLTSSISGIRSVSRIGEKVYPHDQIATRFRKCWENEILRK
jgi:branched-chain amino acid aminotransferase